MSDPLARIAVVDRGHAALRFVRTVREVNGREGAAMRTILLVPREDATSPAAREADEVFPLGSASLWEPRAGRLAVLGLAVLEHALQDMRADAVWIGWDHAAAVHALVGAVCRRLHLEFIGPPPAVTCLVEDKIGAKLLAERAGVPVAPWSGGAVASLAAARRWADAIGYPVMLKATAGTEGVGIARVADVRELAVVFPRLAAEAAATFGEATLFLERAMDGARHVEVDIVGDRHGTVRAVGVRDCTVQRGRRKLLAEAPSPVLTPAEDEALRAAAVRLGQAAGYESVGTVELLFDPRTRQVSFLEVNPGLQGEHPVTEAATGVDLVKLQLHVARGGQLTDVVPVPRGHAVGVRIGLEQREGDRPCRVVALRLPSGPGLRVDCCLAEGQVLPADADGFLVALVATAPDRVQALGRLEQALADTVVDVDGAATNHARLLALLARPEVWTGGVDVGWLDRMAAEGTDHGVARLEAPRAAATVS